MNDTYIKYELQFSFNDPVEVAFIHLPYDERIGRLVQVRPGRGLYGSDLYLIRRSDGSLQAFENVYLQPCNEDMHESFKYEDSEEAEYSISGKFPEVGFLIKEAINV